MEIDTEQHHNVQSVSVSAIISNQNSFEYIMLNTFMSVLLMYWSYYSLVLSHRYIRMKILYMPRNLFDTCSEGSTWHSCYRTCCIGSQTLLTCQLMSLEIDDNDITPGNINGLVQNCRTAALCYAIDIFIKKTLIYAKQFMWQSLWRVYMTWLL